jgi:uncharacterized SAM-binding protein YcdF (DUF218 family)
MRRFPVAEGVPAEKIQVETQSQNTRENALHVTRMLAAESGRKVLFRVPAGRVRHWHCWCG